MLLPLLAHKSLVGPKQDHAAALQQQTKAPYQITRCSKHTGKEGAPQQKLAVSHKQVAMPGKQNHNHALHSNHSPYPTVHSCTLTGTRQCAHDTNVTLLQGNRQCARRPTTAQSLFWCALSVHLRYTCCLTECCLCCTPKTMSIPQPNVYVTPQSP
jgi:hypothetical protein